MEMPINTSAGRERSEKGNGLEYDFAQFSAHRNNHNTAFNVLCINTHLPNITIRFSK